EPSRPLKSVKSLPNLPKNIYQESVKRHWGSPVTESGDPLDQFVIQTDELCIQATRPEKQLITQNEAGTAVPDHPKAFDAQALYPGDACLFVANLPHNFDDLTIKEVLDKVFGHYGTVYVKVKRDRKRMPFAFVQYTNSTSAGIALDLCRGADILGRPCRTERCSGSLTYIIFRNNDRLPQEDEARAILSRFGEIDKIERLEERIQKLMGVPESLLVHFAKFDPRRDVARETENMASHTVLAYDAKLYEERPDRAPGHQSLMEAYDKDRRSIFFGGLPTNADDTFVHTLSSLCGDVVSIDIRTNADNNGVTTNVYAFVEFELPTSPDNAVRQFLLPTNWFLKNGRCIQGYYMRVERKRTQPIEDPRLFPSPLQPTRPLRPHRRGVSMSSTPSKHSRQHRRQQSILGLSPNSRDQFYKADSEYQYKKFMGSQKPLSPLKGFKTTPHGLEEFTPLQSPEKDGSVAAPGNTVQFSANLAFSSPVHVLSPASSSPIQGQQPVPDSDSIVSPHLSFADRMAVDGRPVSYAFSPAARDAADRCEDAIDNKTECGKKGHQRATSMFTRNTFNMTPSGFEVSESDESSSWKPNGSSQDEDDIKEKKEKIRGRLRRRYLSEENLRRNQLCQEKLLKGVSYSESNLRSVSTGAKSHKSVGSKMSRKSDATERPPEGQLVASSQHVVYSQQPVQSVQHPSMVPQYPPPMPVHPTNYSGMPMQPAAPGGLAYMDMPNGPGAQYREPVPMYPSPAQGHYPPPTQGHYPPPAQGHYPPPAQGQYPVPAQGQYPVPTQITYQESPQVLPQGQFPVPAQIAYQESPQTYQNQSQVPQQGHQQAFHEFASVYPENRTIQFETPPQPGYSRRVVSYTQQPGPMQYSGPSQQLQNQHSSDDMSYSGYASTPRGRGSTSRGHTFNTPRGQGSTSRGQGFVTPQSHASNNHRGQAYTTPRGHSYNNNRGQAFTTPRGHSSTTPRGHASTPRAPPESAHQRRQRLEANRYNGYNDQAQQPGPSQ
ncbi:hypothetical protein ACHAP7_007107, partial [Fusarium lateritium]